MSSTPSHRAHTPARRTRPRCSFIRTVSWTVASVPRRTLAWAREPAAARRARVSAISSARSRSAKKLSSVPNSSRKWYSSKSRPISSATRSPLLARSWPWL